MFETTIVALASPNGRGAISIVRLSGINSHSIAEKVTKSKINNQIRKLVFLHNAHGEDFDQALMHIFYAPQSFTGEDLIEFHCHGNPIIVQELIEVCISQGAQTARPGEFAERAFLNSKMNLTEAEAIMDLIAAKNLKLAKAASHQLHGKLGIELKKIKNNFSECLGLIHGPLDFPIESEEAEVDTKRIFENLNENKRILKRLIQNARTASVFRHGIKTAILGRPNVGKSSLMNFLIGHERAIVSAEPGTTRDYLTEEILLGDLPILLIDTAGLRENTESKIEKAGIERSLNIAKEAELILFIYDAHTGWTDKDQNHLERISEGQKVLLIGNKVDLTLSVQQPKEKTLFLSAHSGQGTNELEKEIKNLLSLTDLENEFEFSINQRQSALLNEVQQIVSQLNENTPVEFISILIEEALQKLNELTGENSQRGESAIQAIFSNFCIGK